jgi:response regulator RpfG family c-di-GMP phosphodiesterase
LTTDVPIIVSSSKPKSWSKTERSICCFKGWDPNLLAPDKFKLKVKIQRRKPIRKSLYKVQMTVLIIDDEISILRYISTVLRDVGYEILAADGGDEALVFCKSHAIDLMISDVAMPRMNGCALAACMNAVNPNVPIIFISGYPESKEIVAGLTARGFAHGYTYLKKPFRSEDLMRAIKTGFKSVAEFKLVAAAR